ncbi:MAG: hypothetical protein WBM35_15495, partial [Candidatus Electrothrix sp.]
PDSGIWSREIFCGEYLERIIPRESTGIFKPVLPNILAGTDGETGGSGEYDEGCSDVFSCFFIV